MADKQKKLYEEKIRNSIIEVPLGRISDQKRTLCKCYYRFQLRNDKWKDLYIAFVLTENHPDTKSEYEFLKEKGLKDLIEKFNERIEDGYFIEEEKQDSFWTGLTGYKYASPYYESLKGVVYETDEWQEVDKVLYTTELIKRTKYYFKPGTEIKFMSYNP